jgi:hypothetical protein
MKSETYSWRLSLDLKADLEHAARQQGVSVSRLLERIARGGAGAHPCVGDTLHRNASERRSVNTTNFISP